jgi:hypothetical protein
MSLSLTNTVNCSAAPDCAALNRTHCLTRPNTCESCLDGYIGVVGPSNTACHNESEVSDLGDLGDPCDNGADCKYGFCDEGVCAAEPLTCPSNNVEVCSGAGK